MEKRSLLLLIAAGVALLLVFNKIFWNSDRRAIEKVLVETEHLAEFEKALEPLAVAARVNGLQTYFSENVKIEAASGETLRTVQGFDNVRSSALIGSKLVIFSEITRYGTEIHVSGNQATLAFSLDVEGRDQTDARFKEVFSITATMVKNNNDWVFSEIFIDRLTPES